MIYNIINKFNFAGLGSRKDAKRNSQVRKGIFPQTTENYADNAEEYKHQGTKKINRKRNMNTFLQD